MENSSFFVKYSGESKELAGNEKSGGIFRNRNFLEYFGMNLASRSAGQAANVAVIWFVFAATGSVLDVTIVGVAESIATIVATLPAGVWVDRYNRRLLLVTTNAVRTVCLVLLALLTLALGFEIITIVGIVFVWSCATELYRSTDFSILPDLVEPNQVTDANGVTRSGYQLMGSISSVAGGGLIAFAGAALAFAYGAIGYGLAVLFSFLLFYKPLILGSGEKKREKSGNKRVMSKEIREGFAWLVHRPGLFQLSFSAVFFNFLFGMPFYFLVVYVGVALGGGALLYGGVLAAFVIGDALGSLLVGRTEAVSRPGKTWVVLNGIGTGAALFILAEFPLAYVALVATFALGFVSGFGNNVWLTAAQNLVPAPMRGRYFAIDGLLSFIGGPPSIAVGGILIASIGVSNVFKLSGILLMATGICFFVFVKSLWNLDGHKLEGV